MVTHQLYCVLKVIVKSALLALLAVFPPGSVPVCLAEAPDPAAAEILLTRLNHLLENGAFQEVLMVLEDSLEGLEMTPRLWNAHGLALAGMDRHEEAVDCYEQGLRSGYGLIELHLNLAVSLARLGMSGRAMSEFEQAAELDPESVEALLGWGRYLLRFRRYDAAADVLARARELDPADPRVLRALAERKSRVGESAQDLWKEIETLDPAVDSARELAVLLREDEPRQALEMAEKCFERDPAASDCAALAGSLHLALGELPMAIDRLRKAVEMNASSVAAMRNLILALQQSGRREDLEDLIQDHSPPEGSWGIIALARREAGDGPAALEAVELGLDSEGEDPDLLNLKGVLLAESGDPQRACELWLRVLELDSMHALASANRESWRCEERKQGSSDR